jgi:hypothetical protein
VGKRITDPALQGLSYYARTKLRREMAAQAVEPEVVLPEETVRELLTERFGALNTISDQTVKGFNRACIISGPAGIGKSHCVMQAARKFEERGGKVGVIKGFARPTGLYRALYDHSAQNDLLVFDDCDSAFNDVICLNLLKAALELSDSRRISWMAETKMLTEDGDRLPRTFEYSGNIIFLTNIDMQRQVEIGNNMSSHYEALMSRSLYIDLGMRTKREQIIRIKQVVEEGTLSSHGITAKDASEILEFIEENNEKLRELSLRLVVKLGNLRRHNPKDWKSLGRITCCKG